MLNVIQLKGNIEERNMSMFQEGIQQLTNQLFFSILVSKISTVTEEEAEHMSSNSNDGQVEQEVYRMLTKTSILLDDYDRHFFAEYGLSTRQFWALQQLDREQGCSMVDLSRLLLTDKSNVTGIVDRLERLNLVTRTPDPHDRRVILITLTPEGQRLRDMLSEQHSTRIHDLMSVVNNAHLQSLLEYLQAIIRKTEAYLG
jgi:DNA-binding MarR family transcriptional regulator